MNTVNPTKIILAGIVTRQGKTMAVFDKRSRMSTISGELISLNHGEDIYTKMKSILNDQIGVRKSSARAGELALELASTRVIATYADIEDNPNDSPKEGKKYALWLTFLLQETTDHPHVKVVHLEDNDFSFPRLLEGSLLLDDRRIQPVLKHSLRAYRDLEQWPFLDTGKKVESFDTVTLHDDLEAMNLSARAITRILPDFSKAAPTRTMAHAHSGHH